MYSKNKHVYAYVLGLFLLTRLTWTQNCFIIIISRIRCIIMALLLCPQFHRKAKRPVSAHFSYMTILLLYNYYNRYHYYSLTKPNPNLCNIYISSVSVLDYNFLISPEFLRFFRCMLLRKPLNHLRNVYLEFSRWCVLINRHFHHVNEATVQVFLWLMG